MRALVPVAVVAIIAVTVLVIWLTARRREVRRAELRGLKEQNRLLIALLGDVKAEALVQLDAGNASHSYTAELLRKQGF